MTDIPRARAQEDPSGEGAAIEWIDEEIATRAADDREDGRVLGRNSVNIGPSSASDLFTREFVVEAFLAGREQSWLIATLGRATGLLAECVTLFRMYEAHHRAKAADPMTMLDAVRQDTLAKAERNREIAERLEAFLIDPDTPRDRVGGIARSLVEDLGGLMIDSGGVATWTELDGPTVEAWETLTAEGGPLESFVRLADELDRQPRPPFASGGFVREADHPYRVGEAPSETRVRVEEYLATRRALVPEDDEFSEVVASLVRDAQGFDGPDVDADGRAEDAAKRIHAYYRAHPAEPLGAQARTIITHYGNVQRVEPREDGSFIVSASFDFEPGVPVRDRPSELPRDEFRLETAACLWESLIGLQMLGSREVGSNLLASAVNPDAPPIARAVVEWLESDGTNEVRLTVVGWADECDAAWKAADPDHYQGSFDWDFVPAWLAGKLATHLEVPTDPTPTEPAIPGEGYVIGEPIRAEGVLRTDAAPNVQPVTEGPLAAPGAVDAILGVVGKGERPTIGLEQRITHPDPRFDPGSAVVINGYRFVPSVAFDQLQAGLGEALEMIAAWPEGLTVEEQERYDALYALCRGTSDSTTTED